MFTGLVEEIGRVARIYDENGVKVLVESVEGLTFEGSSPGDSISVNGVCLTIMEMSVDESGDKKRKLMLFGCAPETLRRTNLGELVEGSEVNLERALTPSSRVGGHFVEGHIDCTGEILETRKEIESLWVRIGVPVGKGEILAYIVEKGYIALDGTSLTICSVHEDESNASGWFEVMLIEYTQSKVCLARKKVGDSVNIEVDILAKYVHKARGKVQEAVLQTWQAVKSSVAGAY